MPVAIPQSEQAIARLRDLTIEVNEAVDDLRNLGFEVDLKVLERYPDLRSDTPQCQISAVVKQIMLRT